MKMYDQEIILKVLAENYMNASPKIYLARGDSIQIY